MPYSGWKYVSDASIRGTVGWWPNYVSGDLVARPHGTGFFNDSTVLEVPHWLPLFVFGILPFIALA